MDLGPRYVLSWKCYGQNRYDPYHLYTVLLHASGHLSLNLSDLGFAFLLVGQNFGQSR